MRNIMELSKEEFDVFFSSFDTVLTDCDEVLWVGNKVLPGSQDVMNKLREMGKRTYFVTNNSTTCRDMLATKMYKLGFNASRGEIVNSAYMAARYVDSLGLPDSACAYLIGSPGLEREFTKANISNFGVGPDYLTTDLFHFSHSLSMSLSVDVVVVGFDQYLSVPKLCHAATYLKNSNTHFVATNGDLGARHGHLIIPGTGCVVEAVRTCTGREPVIVGKPEAFYCKEIMDKWALLPEKTLMIGDTAHTDIQLGKRCGFKTLLVLNGVTTLKQVQEWIESGDETKSSLIPDYYIDHLGDFNKWIL